MLLLAIAPGWGGALRNGSVTALLRQGVGEVTGAGLEATLIAASFDTSSGVFTVFSSDSSVNVAGNAVAAAQELEALLDALDIPSTTPTASGDGGAAVARLRQRGRRGLQQQQQQQAATAALNSEALRNISNGGGGVALETEELWLCFNVLGRVVGTTNESYVVAMAAAAAAAAEDGSLAAALAPALAAMAANASFVFEGGSAPNASLLLPPTVVLLPRIMVHYEGGVGGGGGGGLGAGGGGTTGPAVAGAAAGAAIAALCLASLLAATLRRRRLLRKREAQVAPGGAEEEGLEGEAAEAVHSAEVEATAAGEGFVEEEEGVMGGALPARPPFDPPSLPASRLPTPSDSLNALVARAVALSHRPIARGLALPPLTTAALAIAAQQSRAAQEAAAATAAERATRQRARLAAHAEAREAQQMLELAAEPAYRRALLLKPRPDKRKWWSSPHTEARFAHLDTTRWEPLERDRLAALARGDPWPPPDPLDALKAAGARLVGGVWQVGAGRSGAAAAMEHSGGLVGSIVEEVAAKGGAGRTVSEVGSVGGGGSSRVASGVAADVCGLEEEGEDGEEGEEEEEGAEEGEAPAS